METGHGKDQAMIGSLGLSFSPLILQRGEVELIIDHVSMMKPPLKSLKYRVQKPSRLVNTSIFQGDGAHFLSLGPFHTSPYVTLHLAIQLYSLS